jgi:hypothetical protein
MFSKMLGRRRIAGAVLGIAGVLAFGAAIAGSGHAHLTRSASIHYYPYPFPDPSILHGGPSEGSSE